MATVLVVGATGQLGSAIVRRLLSHGHHDVRALVRSHSAMTLPFEGAECRFGDLRNAESLREACEGVDTVIATATVVFPKGRYDFRKDEEDGYANLVQACLDSGVRHIVFVSLCVPFERGFSRISATYRMKERVEGMLRCSGLRHTILRCAPFMDDYFALIGSRIPLAGEIAATLDRSRGLTRLLRAWLGDSIERRGFAIVPGPASRKHAFVALDDVVAYAIAAIVRVPERGVSLDIGGPEVLSWRDVGTLYAALLGRPVRVVAIPARVFSTLARMIRPWSSALANQMAILSILGGNDTHVDSANAALQYDVERLHARRYLEGKLACAASIAWGAST